jgi:hypothetical protein
MLKKICLGKVELAHSMLKKICLGKVELAHSMLKLEGLVYHNASHLQKVIYKLEAHIACIPCLVKKSH